LLLQFLPISVENIFDEKNYLFGRLFNLVGRRRFGQ
jgi:hypothetical protein